jgi:hypothetical protein
MSNFEDEYIGFDPVAFENVIPDLENVIPNYSATFENVTAIYIAEQESAIVHQGLEVPVLYRDFRSGYYSGDLSTIQPGQYTQVTISGEGYVNTYYYKSLSGIEMIIFISHCNGEILYSGYRFPHHKFNNYNNGCTVANFGGIATDEEFKALQKS